VDIKGARFPSQKKSGLRSSHSDVPWCPSLVCRLESLRGHGCRCHEPSDVRFALTAGRALRYQLCLAGQALRQQLCLAGWALRYQLCLAGRALRHQLCLAGRALQHQLCLAGRALRHQLCLAGRALRYQLCLAGRALRHQLCLAGQALRQQPCLAGDCCDNKASSDAQAPLRGARDQYSKILRVFEEAKT
jgi:hypothetical protein